MKKFRDNAIFWVPEHPEKRVTGQLSFDHINGCKVEHIGCLFDRSSIFNAQPIPMMHGSCSNSEIGPFTLYDCIPTGTSFGTGPEVVKYFAHHLFAGNHYGEKNKIPCKSFAFKTDQLDDWVDAYSYNVSVDAKALTGDANPVLKIEGERKDFATFPLPGAKLFVASAGSIPMRSMRKYTLYDEVFFRIEFDQTTPWKSLDADYLWPLQNAMAVLSNTPNACSSIKICPEGAEDTFPFCSVMFKGIVMPDVEPETSTADPNKHLEMLLPMSILAKSNSDFFKNWLTSWHSLKHVVRMLLSPQETSENANTAKFMFYVQAIEGLHRFLTSDEDNADHDAISKREACHLAVKAEDVDLAKWLKDKLSFVHEPSLRDRILYLFNLNSDLIEDLKLDPNQISRKIVDTRNQFAHGWTSRKKRPSFGGLGLTQSQWLLNLVARRTLLEAMGVESNVAFSAVRRTRDYKQLQYFSHNSNLFNIEFGGEVDR